MKDLTHEQYVCIIGLVLSWRNMFPLDYYKRICSIDLTDNELQEQLSKYGWKLNLENTTIEYEE